MLQPGPNPEGSHGVARARGPRTSSPKRTARKPAQKRKRNKTPQIAALWGWGRARTEKARTAQRTSQLQHKQNGQNNSTTLSIAVFDNFKALCAAGTQHRRHARQRLPPNCAKMSFPSISSKKQRFMNWSKPCTYAMLRKSHRQAKPQARAGDAEMPDLGNASRPSEEGRHTRNLTSHIIAQYTFFIQNHDMTWYNFKEA